MTPTSDPWLSALDRLATGTDFLLRLKLLENSEVTGNAGASQKSGPIYTRQYNVSNWLWLYKYWNRLSDKICISFTNVDVIYLCLQTFA